ncbi:class I SAM-dependent methyltransferase [Natranaerovirga pectinivora]|nr:class I SAM-dependent methyltransferase [Natranaerovirga pectinivora]
MITVYDQIGKTYDTTRKADPEIVNRLYYHLQLDKGAAVLDIGCGTGNYTVALNQKGLSMTGMDISSTMIDSAQAKKPDMNWVKGDSSCIPFEDFSFDGAISSLVIHHYNDLEGPFQEAYRIINNGRYVILTSSPEQMRNYWLVEYFPKAMESSWLQMPSVEKTTENLRRVGFTIVGTETFMIQPSLQDFFLYSGKYNPKIYLDPIVRKGISTFASLADKEEIRKGCQRLREDMESGRISEILSKYSSMNGDYVFIVAQRQVAIKQGGVK